MPSDVASEIAEAVTRRRDAALAPAVQRRSRRGGAWARTDQPPRTSRWTWTNRPRGRADGHAGQAAYLSAELRPGPVVVRRRRRPAARDRATGL